MSTDTVSPKWIIYSAWGRGPQFVSCHPNTNYCNQDTTEEKEGCKMNDANYVQKTGLSYMRPNAAKVWINLTNQLQDPWRVCSMSCWHRGLLRFTQGSLRGSELCKWALCPWSTRPSFQSVNKDRSGFRTSCPWHVYISLLTCSTSVWWFRIFFFFLIFKIF